MDQQVHSYGGETTQVSFGLEDLSTQEVRLIHVSTQKLKYRWFTVLLRQLGSLCEDCSISAICGINMLIFTVFVGEQNNLHIHA